METNPLMRCGIISHLSSGSEKGSDKKMDSRSHEFIKLIDSFGTS